MDNNKLLNSFFSGTNKNKKSFIKIESDDESFDNKESKIEDDDLTIIHSFTESAKEEKPAIYTEDIHSIFDRVNNNVKEATDVFYKNIEMKAKLEIDIKEVEKERIKIVKERESLAQELELIKDSQQQLEEEKRKFEIKRKEEYNKFNEIKDEELTRIDNLKNDISHQEETLRRQEDLLNEEKRQFKLEKIKFENEKKELANNLIKFNELVGNFNTGISKFPKEEQ